MGRLSSPPLYRHVDCRDRQRRQDHHPADDPHGAGHAAARHGQPAELQQSPGRALELCWLSRPNTTMPCWNWGPAGAGEIAAWPGCAVPKMGVITRDRRGPPGGFGSRQAIAEAKAELLGVCRRKATPCWATSPGCDGWPNAAGPASPGSATAEIASWRRRKWKTAARTLEFRVAGCRFAIPVWGRHHLTSALAAIAVGRLMGMDLDEMAAALRTSRRCRCGARCRRSAEPRSSTTPTIPIPRRCGRPWSCCAISTLPAGGSWFAETWPN